MNKFKDIKNKYFTEENGFNIMVTLMILFLFMLIWFWIRPTLNVAIGLSTILFISLYYQIMSIRYSVSISMMQMKIEDKIINEMTYQATKRKSTVTFYYDEENKIRIKEYSCSKLKMRLIKWITFIHVLVKPAWWYREDVDELVEQ